MKQQTDLNRFRDT